MCCFAGMLAAPLVTERQPLLVAFPRQGKVVQKPAQLATSALAGFGWKSHQHHVGPDHHTLRGGVHHNVWIQNDNHGVICT